MTTHEVRNQPPPFGGYDLLAGDPVLAGALDRWSPSPGDVTDLARLAATPDPARWADQADTYPPVLRTHDAVGNRLDEVDYHPAYHALMTVAVGHGLGAEPWLANAGTGAHVRRATGFYLWSQVENAHLCPVSMTYAAGPAPAAYGRALRYACLVETSAGIRAYYETGTDDGSHHLVTALIEPRDA